MAFPICDVQRKILFDSNINRIEMGESYDIQDLIQHVKQWTLFIKQYLTITDALTNFFSNLKWIKTTKL